MKRLICAVLCTTLCFGMLAGCSNETSGDAGTESRREESAKESDTENTSASTKQQIELDKEKLVIGVLKKAEPFSFEEDGEWKGYDIDIWKEFEKRTGIPVEWYQYDSAEILTEDLMVLTSFFGVGMIDVLAVEGPSSLNGTDFLVTEPVSYSGLTLAVDSNNESVQSISDVSGGLNIGIESSLYSMEESVKAANSGLEILGSFTNFAPDILAANSAGVLPNVLPLALLDIEGWYAMKKDEGLNIRLLEPFGYVDGCYCVTDEKVQNAANTFIQSIKEDGTLKKISEKWFGADVSAERQ
ncbi:MAG: amino acid ABC transporter substrate-binding protein [Dorea sp.]|jgi:putative amino-acid transport system substrate-binding protein|nr:amino acid ABC transporter substrate-binding protein [Dorea sp.]